MKPKTLLGLQLCLAFLYVAIIIRQWPDLVAEVAALALYSPVASLRTHTLC